MSKNKNEYSWKYWMLFENKQKYLLLLNFSGAVVNVVLNLALIPIWGAVGVAAASLITQMCTNVVFGFFIKDLRPNNRLLFRSLNIKIIRNILINFFADSKHMLIKEWGQNETINFI